MTSPPPWTPCLQRRSRYWVSHPDRPERTAEVYGALIVRCAVAPQSVSTPPLADSAHLTCRDVLPSLEEGSVPRLVLSAHLSSAPCLLFFLQPQ